MLWRLHWRLRQSLRPLSARWVQKQTRRGEARSASYLTFTGVSFSMCMHPISSAHIHLAFVFWSLFTALIPTLFYFSIWELGIAGAEAALFALLTPALLSTTPFFLPSTPKSAPSANKTEDETGIHIPTWYAMLRTRRGQVVAYLVQYTALLAFLSNSPSVRLGVVFVAVSAMTAREVVLWAGLVEGEGEEDGHGWSYWSVVSVSAFVVASGLKGVNHGNNPSKLTSCVCSPYGTLTLHGIQFGLSLTRRTVAGIRQGLSSPRYLYWNSQLDLHLLHHPRLRLVVHPSSRQLPLHLRPCQLSSPPPFLLAVSFSQRTISCKIHPHSLQHHGRAGEIVHHEAPCPTSSESSPLSSWPRVRPWALPSVQSPIRSLLAPTSGCGPWGAL